MKKNYACGVDIGGSHITAALIDCATYEVLEDTMVRKRIDSKGSATQIIHAWAEALEPLLEDNRRVGIAMPGPFDYEQGISLIQSQDKYDALYQMNVKSLLADQLHISGTSIRLANDASCFLKGEVLGGALKGMQHAIGITLGTGLGAAAYHAPQAQDMALWCSPFRNSIAEDYISTRWCTERYTELTGKDIKDVRALSEAVAEGDKAAQLVFNELGDALGHFLAPVIRAEQAEAVVLGGNIARSMPLFMPVTLRVLAEAGINVPVRQSLLGESAALLGAVCE